MTVVNVWVQCLMDTDSDKAGAPVAADSAEKDVSVAPSSAVNEKKDGDKDSARAGTRSKSRSQR